MSDKSYLRRIPPPCYVYNYELENLLLDCGNSPQIKSYVINHGHLYGRTSFKLLNTLVPAIENRPLKCFGEGDNYIPFLHIEDLCQSVEKIVTAEP